MSATSLIKRHDGAIESTDSSGIRVVAATHPFKVSPVVDDFVIEGFPLSKILEYVQPDPVLRRYAVIFANSEVVPRDFWGRYYPKHGTVITIRIVPCGGGGDGGKNPLRTVLTIAVIAASFVVGPAVSGALRGLYGVTALTAGQTAFLGAVSTGLTYAITAGGLLAVNALVPIRPPTANTRSNTLSEDSPSLFISGARNEARPFKVIPCVLGKHKQIPPYGALPFTEIVGNDQYLRLAFVWGYGPLKIENLKIGDTPLENFTGVDVYHRQGFQDDPDLQLFTEDVFEENLQISLPQSAGFVTRFSTSQADEISVDFVFPRGLVQFNSQGQKQSRTVELQVEYAPVGSSSWVGDTAAISQTDSPQIPAEPGTKKILVNGVETDVPADNPHRIDVVCIDRASGAVSIVRGQTVFGASTAAAPQVPDTKIPLAEVARGTTTVITNADITDVRPGSATFQTPATDFLVTEDSPQADNVVVAAGTLVTPLKLSVTGRTTSAVRKTLRFKTPSRQQYQIRCKRITADTSSAQIADEVTWVVLRTFTEEPAFEAKGLATTELRIKASDQLQNIVDQLTGVVTSILPDWDSGSGQWKVRETQNPASLYRAVLQGPANKRPLADSRLNLTALQDWHEKNDAQGLKFNMVRDFRSSVWDTLLDVCAAAYASPTRVDGKYSVVIDEPKTTFRQHFSPRNSSGFHFERAYVKSPHAWRARFINELDDYSQDTRPIYDDGYDKNNATKFEEIDLISTGITNPDQVWKYGRRRIFEQRLRPERFTINTDYEHLICTRGDMVLLTHDVLSVGLGSGRIKQVVTDGGGDATSIVIDDAVPMEAGKDYMVSVRTLANTSLTAEVVTVVGDENTTLTFKTPIPAANIPNVGDLYGFGEADKATETCLVHSIEGASDLAARLTLIPYAEPVFTSDTGDIPVYTPNITQAPGTVTPFVIEIDSSENVLLQTSQGDLIPRIKLVLSRVSSTLINRPTAVEVQIRETGEEEFRSIVTPRQESLTIFIDGVEEGIQYDIKLRYITENGEGPFSSIFQHTVVGTSTLPADVTDLVTEGPFLRWAYAEPPLDFRGFLVRTSLDTATPWESAQPAHAGYLEVAELNIGNFQRKNRLFLVKAVDQAGNESQNAATLIRDAGDEPVENVQRTVDLDQASPSAYPGTITGGTVVGSELRADGSSLYLPNDTELYLPTDGDLYLPDNFAELIYITEVQTITSSDGNSQAKLDIAVEGTFVIEYKWGKDNNIDLAEWRPFPGFKDVQEDDQIQWRVKAQSSGGQTKITNMDIIIDAEDEKEEQENVSISAAGTRLTLSKAYRSIKVVAVTLQSPTSGDYVKVVDKQATAGANNGPLIEIYNSSDTKISGTVDVIIQGVKA